MSGLGDDINDGIGGETSYSTISPALAAILDDNSSSTSSSNTSYSSALPSQLDPRLADVTADVASVERLHLDARYLHDQLLDHCLNLFLTLPETNPECRLLVTKPCLSLALSLKTLSSSLSPMVSQIP